MREIKFRSAHYTYDGKFHSFSYWGKIDAMGNYADDCFTGMTMKNGTKRKADEQYTGLKDKNGVEIYEGDLVKVTYGDRHYWIYEISTAGDQFGGCLFSMLIEHNLESVEDFYTYNVTKFNKTVRQYITAGKDAEVIGNIHENPELLKT